MLTPATGGTIRDAQSGNSEAFRIIYREYKDRVYGYALRLLGDSADAQDAVQDAFVRVHEHLPELDHPGSFRYWLFTIVRNEVFGRLRRRSSLRLVPLDGMGDSVWDPDTPHDGAVRSETAEIIRRLIAGLKPEYREVILLRDMEGMSYVEIAAVIGDTEAAVKARLFKARKTLSQAWDATYSETRSA